MSDETQVVDAVNNVERDIRDIKRNIKIESENEGTYVFAIAVNVSNYGENKVLEIPAVTGNPITILVYDLVRDVFHVEAVSYHEIGYIPASYIISVPNTIWRLNVPLPNTVLNKYFSPVQRENFEQWKKKFNKKDYSIQFIQLTSSEGE